MRGTYYEWIDGFERLKAFTPPAEMAIKQALGFYSQAISESEQAQREGWSHVLGYRKKSNDGLDRGEKKIERLLFDVPQIEIVRDKRSALWLEVTDYNFPLARQSKGQVLCDALGFIQHRRRYHPVAIEVKITNANLWFAVIENLIQIRLARFNLTNIERHATKDSLASKHLQKVRGAWGLILAPGKYFDRSRIQVGAALKLIQELKREKKEARIILASTDDLKDGRLKWIEGSYWPS